MPRFCIAVVTNTSDIAPVRAIVADLAPECEAECGFVAGNLLSVSLTADNEECANALFQPRVYGALLQLQATQ